MSKHAAPIMDENDNPFYCPTVSAESYINSLRANLQKSQHPRQSGGSRGDEEFHSFAQILNQTLVEDGDTSEDDSLELRLPQQNLDVINFANFKPHRSSFPRSQLEVEIPEIPRWSAEESQEAYEVYSLRSPRNARKRRRLLRDTASVTFSDIDGPERHEKSFDTTLNNESTLYITAQAEKLDYMLGTSSSDGIKNKHKAQKAIPNFVGLTDRIRQLEGELYGEPIGSESPRGLEPLIERLDAILPGIRLKERLRGLKGHQSIADMLGKHGHLNTRVLTLLRTSEIRCLALSDSLVNQNGLNLSGRETFAVFSKPNSFLFLSELSLTGTQINDFDLVHVHHLPRLSTLGLNDTTIGNEAIYLLVPLKRTLTNLSIATNPRITDFAVNALLLLSKLSYLCIIDTAIGMTGMRQLAVAIDQGHVMTILVPFECETYMDNVHSQYLASPAPPLIKDPAVVPSLSNAALIRNLAAHAKVNPNIAVGGSKVDMAKRLKTILEIRVHDELVANMLTEDSSEGDGSGV